VSSHKFVDRQIEQRDDIDDESRQYAMESPSGRPRDKLPLMQRIPLVLPEVQVQVNDIR